MGILYRDEFHKIPFRCLAGCREGIVNRGGVKFFREKKEAMTPEKRVIINSMFRSRIYELEISMDEKLARVAQQYVNRILKSAISTVQTTHTSLNENIDEFIEEHMFEQEYK